MNLKKIAIYGKGGIGKSTTTANMAAAMSKLGLKVLQIGCDPKADSTRFLTGGVQIPTVLEQMRAGKELTLDDIVFPGYNGVLCVEAGGPTPGIGCAGRGIITAFEKLQELEAYEVYQPDVVLYDVLGDVVCGGFAMPIRDGYADKVFVVTSGEMMAMYAASNIATAVHNFARRNYAGFGGLILNRRNVENELELVGKLAQELHTGIVGVIPRDGLVQQAETNNQTVVEAFPDSALSAIYTALATEILAPEHTGV